MTGVADDLGVDDPETVDRDKHKADDQAPERDGTTRPVDRGPVVSRLRRLGEPRRGNTGAHRRGGGSLTHRDSIGPAGSRFLWKGCDSSVRSFGRMACLLTCSDESGEEG